MVSVSLPDGDYSRPVSRYNQPVSLWIDEEFPVPPHAAVFGEIVGR
jgi:hypothetical protein